MCDINIEYIFNKLEYQWWINKAKADPDTDYSIRVNFLKLKLKGK